MEPLKLPMSFKMINEYNAANVTINPFKIIAQQPQSGSKSDILSDIDKGEKQPPDTPMIEYKHFSFLNGSFRGKLLTQSD